MSVFRSERQRRGQEVMNISIVELLFVLVIGLMVFTHFATREYESEVDSAQARIEQLLAVREDLEKRLGELQDLLEEREAQIARLERRYAMLLGAVRAGLPETGSITPEGVKTELEKITEGLEERAKLNERIEALENEQRSLRNENSKLSNEVRREKRANQRLASQLQQTREALDRAEDRIAALNNRLQSVRGGRGAGDDDGGGYEVRRCHVPGTPRGQTPYIYDVTMYEDGFRIEANWPERYDRAYRVVDGIDRVSRVEGLLNREFVRFGRAIFAWSQRNDCRFFVNVINQIASLNSFRHQMSLVERYFYKRELD